MADGRQLHPEGGVLIPSSSGLRLEYARHEIDVSPGAVLIPSSSGLRLESKHVVVGWHNIRLNPFFIRSAVGITDHVDLGEDVES